MWGVVPSPLKTRRASCLDLFADALVPIYWLSRPLGEREVGYWIAQQRGRISLRRLRHRQDTRLQQIDVGASLHRTLDRFQTVHLALRLTLAPREGQSCFHRSKVLFETGNQPR